MAKYVRSKVRRWHNAATGQLASLTRIHSAPPVRVWPQDREAHMLDYPALSYPHVFVLQASGRSLWAVVGVVGRL